MLQGVTKWITALSGLVATAAAVTVLASLPGPDTNVSEPSTTTIEVTAPGSDAVSETVEVPAPSEPIEGIDPAVSDALVASGYTEFMTTSELERQLPASVVDVLDRAGAVLVIPNQGSSDAR